MNRTFPDQTEVRPAIKASLEALAADLLSRDFLYDDPASYRAGVMAVLNLAAERRPATA